MSGSVTGRQGGSRARTTLALAALLAVGVGGRMSAAPPNILLVYADDLGYGDVGCNGATAVATPHVDRLAREGLRFTDAHAAAATCTPSRYALLTGEYAWRKKGTGVLPGDASLIIDPGRTTLPSMLRKAGYRTGAVGKWHLGLGKAGEPLDWNQPIRPGPREIGFDYSFIMAATGDRVPCVYVADGKVVGLDPADPIRVSYQQAFDGEPTGIKNRADLRLDWSHGHNMAVVNGIGRIGFMQGGKAALWKDEDMADVFVRQGVRFLEESRKAPFFLYFGTHDIHVPRVPHPRFVGKTTMGARGDAIVQFDWCVGELLATLDRLNLATNTLVVFTSDNGPVIDDGYQDGAVAKLGAHKPAGPWRGGKYSAFEGGTRVPLVVRWPGRVKPGVSGALVCQMDLLTSLAALVGQPLATGDGPDGRNVLPALLGESATGREELVEQGNVLALRQGAWKYIVPGKGPRRSAYTDTDLANDPGGMLFDLAADPGETRNVAATEAARVRAMAARLEALGAAGGGR